MNPYEAPSTFNDDAISVDNRSNDFRGLIRRPTFAIGWILTWALFGIGFLLSIHKIYPIPSIDFGYYLRLYATIGAVSGLLGWYAAWRVALHRLSFRAVFYALLLPYGFVASLALVVNFPVAILATFLFGGVVLLAFAVRPNER